MKSKNCALTLTLEEHYTLVGPPRKGGRQCDNGLLGYIHFAIEMEVMVMNNLQMDLDTTNGTCSVVFDIVLNTEEPPFKDGFMFTLKHLLECILVKLLCTNAVDLPDLDEGVILV